MRRILVSVAVLLQFLALGYMAGQREWVVRTGKTVWLRTAPIDPRDPFRGDFVRLEYEASLIPPSLQQGELRVRELKRDEPVFVELAVGEGGLADVRSASLRRPAADLVLRGRCGTRWGRWFGGRRSTRQAVHLRYGIEAYFVQQGRGRELEAGRNSQGMQVPLEMEIALGGNGLAIIRGHRWSPIGIGIEILPQPGQQPGQRPLPQPVPANAASRPSAKLKLRLMNASTTPLAVLDFPDLAQFGLEPSANCQQDWEPAWQPQTPPVPEDGHVRVLKPGEIVAFDVDLANTRWQVRKPAHGQEPAGPPVQLGGLNWSETFRLVYRPPAREACAHLADRDKIWHGVLPSRAVHGQGRVD